MIEACCDFHYSCLAASDLWELNLSRRGHENLLRIIGIRSRSQVICCTQTELAAGVVAKGEQF